MKANARRKRIKLFLLGVFCSVLASSGFTLITANSILEDNKPALTTEKDLIRIDRTAVSTKTTHETNYQPLADADKTGRLPESGIQSINASQLANVELQNQELQNQEPQKAEEVYLFKAFNNNQRALDIIKYLKKTTSYRYEVETKISQTNPKFQVKLIVPPQSNRQEITATIAQLTGMQINTRWANDHEL